MAYGAVFRDASGAVRLTLDEAMPRIVHEQRFSWEFEGTISVPGFDSDYGMFYVSPSVRPQIDGGPGYEWHEGSGDVWIPTTPLPSLSWNNNTKVMTIDPNVFPENWPAFQPLYYWLIFLAVNKRFEI